MTKKQQKEYEDEIRALNSVLLEWKDQMNALGHERDRWKYLAMLLMKKMGVPFNEDEEPDNLIDNI